MRYARLFATTGFVAFLSGIIVPSSTETAAANGDTRTLNLYHSHTGESIEATFRVNGSYDPAVLAKLNYFLRDWRNNDQTRMDPRLFDVIWEAYRTAGATQPIVIVSAYRSPATNAMLRARSHAVAEHSQHILGRAMDTTMPGMSMERIREIGMRLQRGGVGWYPSENFVHLDVGNIRAWPRMSYDQLVRLFPDGKTVHLAADGRTLPRYQEARAEIAARGGTMSDVPQYASSGGGLFAWLFGKRDEERGEEKEAQTAAAAPPGVRAGRTRRGGTEVASLRTNGESPAGEAPANSSSGRGTSEAAAPPAETPGRNASRNEQTATGANRTVVADLSAGSSSRDAAATADKDQTAAAAGSPNIGKRWTLSTPVPLPPLRPALSGDHALAFADVPEPPARPAALTRVAALAPPSLSQNSDASQAAKNNPKSNAAGGAATATPLARAANLPVVITQGPKDHVGVPHHVLAFAAETPLQDSAIPASKTPGQTLSRLTPQPSAAAPEARLDRARSRGLASDVATASFPAPSILGPTFTGLRRAARITSEALSNTPSAGYVTAFRAAASVSDLDASHFTGAAAKPRELARGLVHAGEDGSVKLRGN